MLDRAVTLKAAPRGLMFHHLHSDTFKGGEGSISVEDFVAILDHYGDRVLDAQEWTERRRRGKLSPDHVCLTFDDALLCQYELALPIMRKRGLTALWYVYSTALDGTAEGFEIARHYRLNAFDGFKAFFNAFLATAKRAEPALVERSLSDFVPSHYLAQAPFYSDDERTYRFLRDRVLGEGRLRAILALMMQEDGFDPREQVRRLWLTWKHVSELTSAGHVIGLHSYSHPTTMKNLPLDEQLSEYSKNMDDIAAVTGRKPDTMAHPCNSYSCDTLRLLSDLGIREGFCTVEESVGVLEMPRTDVALIQKQLGSRQH